MTDLALRRNIERIVTDFLRLEGVSVEGHGHVECGRGHDRTDVRVDQIAETIADSLSPMFTATRELVEELNRHAASGLITREALVMINRVQQLLPR